MTNLSCTTTTDCWSLGPSSVFVSSDLGGTWTPHAFPTGIPFSAMSCPTPTHCWAAGIYTASAPHRWAMFATTNDGRNWHADTVPSEVTSIGTVSCPNTTDCWAVALTSHAASSIATTDGGAVWTLGTVPSLFGTSALGMAAYLAAATCSTSTRCWAVGSPGGEAVVASTTDLGSSWATRTLPRGPAALTALACADSSDCLAFAEGYGSMGQVVATTNGGATWQRRASMPDGLSDPKSSSCPTASLCWVVSDTVPKVGVTTDVGKSWMVPLLTASSAVSMAPTPDGGGYWLTTQKGNVYPFGDARFFGSKAGAVLPGPVVSMAPSPDGGGYWLTTQKGNVYPFGDARFFGSKAGAVLPGPVVSLAPSPDGGAYWLTTQKGNVYPFGDARFFGSKATVPPLYYPDGVSCPTIADCFVVGRAGPKAAGGVILATTDAGATWNADRLPPEVFQPLAVSCATAEQCVAVGTSNEAYAVEATTNGGAAWTWETISGAPSLVGASCPSATVCVAVGQDAIVATIDAGRSWRSDTPPVSADYLGVSCPTVSDCWTVGVGAAPAGAVAAVTNNGGATWTSDTLPADIIGLDAVTCPTTGKCWALGTTNTGAAAVVATGTG